MLLVILLAIICIVTFINAVSLSPEYVTHHILQELMFLSSIIALGFCGVISYLRDISNKLKIQEKSNKKEVEDKTLND